MPASFSHIIELSGMYCRRAFRKKVAPYLSVVTYFRLLVGRFGADRQSRKIAPRRLQAFMPGHWPACNG